MSTSSFTPPRRRESFTDRRRRTARQSREADDDPGIAPVTPDFDCPRPDGATRQQSGSFDSPPSSTTPPRSAATTPFSPTSPDAIAATAAALALRTSRRGAYLTGEDDGGAGAGAGEQRAREAGAMRGSSGGYWQTVYATAAEELEAASTVHRLGEFRDLMLELEYNMRWDAQQPTWRQCRNHWRGRVEALTPGAETCAHLSKSLLGASGGRLQLATKRTLKDEQPPKQEKNQKNHNTQNKIIFVSDDSLQRTHTSRM